MSMSGNLELALEMQSVAYCSEIESSPETRV
jgi:hypothetical protein